MLENTITLHVDELNNATLVDIDYDRFDQYQNRSVYIAETHTIAAPDTLTLYRTFPKTSGNYLGQMKVTSKFSKTISVPGVDGSDVQGPLILEISASMPVGATSAQRKLMRQRAIALIDRDDIMIRFMDNLEI